MIIFILLFAFSTEISNNHVIRLEIMGCRSDLIIHSIKRGMVSLLDIDSISFTCQLKNFQKNRIFEK